MSNRYEVGAFAVVVDDSEPEPVRFESSDGHVLAKLTWQDVSDLQTALVEAELAEAAARRATMGQ